MVEGGEIRLEKPASGDHDHIDSESCPCLGAPAENLSHQAFRAIPGYRVSNFSARHQPEPCFTCWVRSYDERDIAAVPAASDGKGSLELGTPANPAVSAETLGLHWRHPAGAGAWWPVRSGRRRDRQSFPALGPATLQDEPTVLRAHAHQEAVCATAATTVWLERTFHDRGSLVAGSKWRRNVDSSEAPLEVSILGHRGALARKTEPDCQRSKRVLKSRPLRLPRRVSPRSFPQLWKKMWKSQSFRPSARPPARLARGSTQRRCKTGRKYNNPKVGVHVKRR